MKWQNCTNMLQHKRRYSTQARKKLTLKRLRLMTERASDL
jgi:hypothetical protein